MMTSPQFPGESPPSLFYWKKKNGKFPQILPILPILLDSAILLPILLPILLWILLDFAPILLWILLPILRE